MWKRLLILYILVFVNFIGITQKIYAEDWLKEVNCAFNVVNKSNDYYGTICIENGLIKVFYASEYIYNEFYEAKEENNTLEIFFLRSFFFPEDDDDEDVKIPEGEEIFLNRKWIFPRCYKVSIEKEKILEATRTQKSINIQYDDSRLYPARCQAIIIDNLNIRDKPSLSGKKIGMLKKRSEVTLYEESENWDEIDSGKNPWYKVKIDAENYGWVYGGYVRIFFIKAPGGNYDKVGILRSIK